MKTANTDIITQCPQCKTAFKVTQNVLQVAKGTVRCGSCLRVFDALEYQLNKPEAAATSEDESWALKLLEEEENTASDDQLSETTIEAAPNNDKKSSDKVSNTKKSKTFFRKRIDTSDTSLIDEPETHSKHQGDDTNIATDENTDETESNDLTGKPSSHTNDDATDASTEELGDIDADLDDSTLLLERIELDPLELEENNQQRSFKWLAGAITMATLLLIQIAWLRFDTLSTQAPYRQYYAIACQHIGCTLPLHSDTQQIKATQLVVRSHITEKNALTVDAIIINNANFEQPYPALELVFLNIHGKPVASRAFQPREYLRGELTGATVMPTNQPIQLSLAIVDPGESAVNYHIDAIPPISAR